MMDAWLAFARTGDPSTPALPWPVYDTDTRPTMVFGRQSRVEPAPRDEERAAVEAALYALNRPFGGMRMAPSGVRPIHAPRTALR